jgi:hypothetical protein
MKDPIRDVTKMADEALERHGVERPAEREGLPSAEDLDAVAEEQRPEVGETDGR